MIVQAATGMTLLGAAPVDHDLIDLALRYAPFLVVADGGAKIALANGHVPRAVIGDMDSIGAGDLVQIPSERLHRISEQDSTDFEKCLLNCTAPFTIAVGMTGGRLDHTMAAMTALVQNGGKTVILLGDTDVCFLCPTRLSLNLPIGTRFSLYPMGTATGRSEGLKWPIDGIAFSPDSKIGTSNEVSHESQEVTIETANMLVILPNQHLGAVLDALTA